MFWPLAERSLLSFLLTCLNPANTPLGSFCIESMPAFKAYSKSWGHMVGFCCASLLASLWAVLYYWPVVNSRGFLGLTLQDSSPFSVTVMEPPCAETAYRILLATGGI